MTRSRGACDDDGVLREPHALCGSSLVRLYTSAVKKDFEETDGGSSDRQLADHVAHEVSAPVEEEH